MYDTDVTIYNYRYDSVTKTESWKRTQIEGVSWYGGQKISVGDKGLNSADAYVIRIPLNKTGGFLLPEKYDALDNHWTLQAGDIIVKGLLDQEITKKVELSSVSQKFVVTGFSDNRRGIPLLQHIKVDGK